MWTVEKLSCDAVMLNASPDLTCGFGVGMVLDSRFFTGETGSGSYTSAD